MLECWEGRDVEIGLRGRLMDESEDGPEEGVGDSAEEATMAGRRYEG